MGKSKQFKKLRKLAESLPEINTKRTIGSEVYGRDLLGRGLKTLKRKDGTYETIDADKLYVEPKKEITPMNHERNMKKNFYKNGGMKGVEAYHKTVVNYVAANPIIPAIKKEA